MKEKFTPGPWGACKIKHYHPQLIGETCCVKIGENIIEIDYIGIGNENKDYKQSEANAALIAAAPEMYEFGETTAEVLQLLISYLGPKASGLNAEIKRLAEERIAEWKKIEKKARGER